MMKLFIFAVLCAIFGQSTAENNTCPATMWEDGYQYSEKETPNPDKRRCIVLEVWKRVKHVSGAQKGNKCSPLIECMLYPYDVTVELQKDYLEFKNYTYEEGKSTLTELDDKSLKWEIDGVTTAEKYNGTFKLTICFGVKQGRARQVSLSKISTLKLIKPAVNVGISGTAYCEEDDDE